jgi:hypothetical protein
MDRKALEESLRRAEGIVQIGHDQIEQQKILILQLEKDKQSSRAAKNLLKTFRELQLAHVKRRDDLKRQLMDGE